MQNPTAAQAFQTILAISFLGSSESPEQTLSTGIIEATITPECFELGVTEFGWRLDVMLTELFSLLDPWQKEMIEGDLLVIPFHVWQLMMVEIVSL